MVQGVSYFQVFNLVLHKFWMWDDGFGWGWSYHIPIEVTEGVLHIKFHYWFSMCVTDRKGDILIVTWDSRWWIWWNFGWFHGWLYSD